jgi:glutamate---cysteine ligase / carboxylate-amine ligase
MTVGIEEEVMVLDPESLDLAPVAAEILPDDPRFKLELPAAQLEIVSPPVANAREAARFLADARADLSGARFACAGVHPFAAAEGVLNAAERYRWVQERYGRIACRQLVFGLQVHVAVRGAGRALAVYNALRSYLPELLALAANSPYYLGEDTGLAAVRPKICELLPRQGVPPIISSWDEYGAALRWAALPDPRFWWWELRPHPDFGTLELRVADAQTTVAEASAVVAVVHCLCGWLAERHAGGERLPVAPTWRIEENRWRALRDGVEGELVDLETGVETPTRERLVSLIEALRPTAERLGCAVELLRARQLVRENGAIRQRQVGLARVAEWLAERYLEPLPGQD